MSDDERMDPGELQAVREYLGLTTEDLAKALAVRPDTARRWESGRDPIPGRVPSEVAQIEDDTASTVAELVDALRGAADPVAHVYRTDAALWAARPEVAPRPARWWRHVVMRATERVPDVRIVQEPR